MRKLNIFFAAACVIVMMTGLCIYFGNDKSVSSDASDYISAVNEIEHLYDRGDNERGSAAAERLIETMRGAEDIPHDSSPIVISLICVLFLGGIWAYTYFSVIRPFHRLENFAERVARGELDIPLEYERSNCFGKFTWAFDSMRREILRSRTAEKAAIENNKTAIASLSHDIRTPAAAVRAYAEALEAGMDRNAEKRAEYIGVILRKCDDITRVTDDMLLHSLSELDALKISAEDFELGAFAENVIKDNYAHRANISYSQPSFPVVVRADKQRTCQIIENLVNNSVKYGGGRISITLTVGKGFGMLIFRDFGKGIPDGDMPFVFDKFYRGNNTDGQEGSGLGLYIVRYIAIGSGGDVKLRNQSDGLEVTVYLPLAGP